MIVITFKIIIAHAEGNITNFHFKEWSSMYDSAWYAYGTFMGESITRDTKSEKATALRIAIGVWILYCLIISNSYGGSLKAFLTSPQRTNPIDTLEQVIDSELPWEMVMYGEEEEEMMASSKDPVISKIWKGIIEVKYKPVPDIYGVFKGEKVFIDWKSGLEPAVYVRFSKDSGERQVHIAGRPLFMPNYPGKKLFIF